MDEKYVSYVWLILKKTIQSLQRESPDLSHEQLYHKAYERVMNKHGFRMYNGLRELLAEHMKQKVLPELLQNLDNDFLAKLNKIWVEHQTSMMMLGDMLGYMDKTYAAARGLEGVYRLGLQIFRYEVISTVEIKQALREKLLGMIKAERLGETINQLEIKNACTMFVTLSTDSRYVYEKIFEKPFLIQTAEFYELESQRLLANKAVDYEQEMQRHIEKESARASQYLNNETEKRVVELLEQIIEKHKPKDAQ